MLQKDHNPYTGLLGLMKKHGNEGNPTVYAIGQVVSILPLKVKVGGIELDEEDLRINADLLKGYKRKLKLTGDICTCEGDGSSTGGGDSSGTGDGDTGGGDSGDGGGSSTGGETGGGTDGSIVIGTATDIIGLLKGDGTAISAAVAGSDYAAPYRKGTLTLAAALWADNAQTVTVSALTDADDVTVSPKPDSFDAYCAAGIRCDSQSGNTLTFLCDTVPEKDINVNFKLEIGVAV